MDGTFARIVQESTDYFGKMKLDYSRFEAFWRSPERYRLVYECNLVPLTLNYSLSRGIAFHLIKESRFHGFSEEDTRRLVDAEVIDKKAVAVAWQMWQEWERWHASSGIIVKAAELEFDVLIVGSPHSIVGRLDEIIEWREQTWVGEAKTTNAKKTLPKLQEEWRTNKQASFVLIGARELGYEPEGVLVRAVVEKNPPIILPLDVHRTPLQLEQLKLEVHQTAEWIEFARAHFGIDQPWPHKWDTWPCMRGGECEYEGICGRPKEMWNRVELEKFKQREEHLVILQTAAEPKDNLAC